MAFKLVQGTGSEDIAVVNIYASGVVRPGMVVEFANPTDNIAFGYIAPGSADTTTQTIFGVCQEYAQGGSETRVKVIPIISGQIWEADCLNNTSTAQVFLRHSLAAGGVTINNTSTDKSSDTTGVFLAHNVIGAAADRKLIGELLRRPLHA